MIINTPKPPYYAVIFTSIKSENADGYTDIAELMDRLLKEEDGFLGYEAATDGVGITVSYWKDVPSILKWKNNPEHKEAQEKGKSGWYKSYKTRIALVERDYGFEL